MRAAALALALLAPGAAWACYPSPPGAPDHPIVVQADGSFVNAGPAGGPHLQGRPIRDIGAGRLGQVLVTDDDRSCAAAQALLFVDCTAGEALLVWGLPGEVAADEGLVASARALQPPHGPLGLTASTTVEGVRALARAKGWPLVDDVPAFAQAHGPQNAFDPFLGCTLLYPGSVGASR